MFLVSRAKGDKGPEAVINYLANYVTGACISDRRLVSDERGKVTIRVKDYKAGDVKLEAYDGAEIVRRFVLHILPRALARVRYSGIFIPSGRAERLERIRELIAAEKQASSLPSLAEQHPPQAAELQAADQPDQADGEDDKPTCKRCNRCHSEMDSLGHLNGARHSD